MKKFLFIIFIFVILFRNLFAQEENFDFVLAITQQNSEMDWWFAVPYKFGPKVSQVNEVTKGEYFKILPIFNNFGVTPEKQVDITYDVEIIKPDGTIVEAEKNVIGFKGFSPGKVLLPALGIIVVSFDPDDSYGEHIIRVSANDHIKNQKINKITKIKLREFNIKEFEGNLNDWVLSYPINPQPSFALSAFIQPIRPYLDANGHPLWSALWLYKYIFSENEFLIPYTLDFYKTKASKQQQKDIILLFYLLGRINELEVDVDLQEYLHDLKKIHIPNPYADIETGEQLDMLWAEFFATGRVKPIRQIISSFKYSEFLGTLEKIKNQHLDINFKNAKHEAMLEAIFGSAIWSLGSNCKQSELLFQYCVGLYQSEELIEVEKKYLAIILKKIRKEINLSNSSDVLESYLNDVLS